MAIVSTGKVKKEHRKRKNPGAAEDFAKRRKAQNALRPKQVFDQELGIWIR